MALFEIDSHWRDSARNPQFFVIDARSSFPFLLFIVHIKVWTLVTAIGASFCFGMLERYSFSVIVFLRMLRSLLAGKRKLTRPWWREETLY